MSIAGTLATAISGLNANAFVADVAANNIVNQNTPGFKPTIARTTSIASTALSVGGVQVQLLAGGGEVNLAGEFTRLILAAAAYRANASAIRVAENVARTTVDILA